MNIKILKLVSTFLLFAIIINCENDNPTSSDSNSYLSFESTITATPFKDSLNIRISTNTTWKVSNISNWLKCSPDSGNGENFITVYWDANLTSNMRTGIIEITAGHIVKSITVKQAISIQIINSSWRIRNGMIENEDSINVLFNKEIYINSLKHSANYCSPNIQVIYNSNHHGISFAYSCAKLGGDYSFDINVQDSSGNAMDFYIDVPLYSKKCKLDGTILNYYLNDDQNAIWILTESPNTITLLNYPDLSIQNQILLDFSPYKMSINPYNKYAYILSNDYGIDNQGYSYFSNIYIINLENGELIKKIHLKTDEYDHPQHPDIFPYDIGFTKNGYGIFLQGVKTTSALRWKVIDSAKNDTIFIHNAYGFDNGQYPYFNRIYSNLDNSKLFLTPPYGSREIIILDDGTHSFRSLVPEPSGRGNFLVPNRKNGLIYVCQLYEQFIMDLSGNYGILSYIDSRGNSSADFSYRNSEENIIYFCNENYLSIDDYNKAEVLFWTDHIGLADIKSSLDGKYIFMIKDNSIYQFVLDLFY